MPVATALIATIASPSCGVRRRGGRRRRAAEKRYASGSRSASTHEDRRRRPRDAGMPYLDRPALQARDVGEKACAPAAEFVGVHGDVDAGRATLQAAWPKTLVQSRTSSLPA